MVYQRRVTGRKRPRPSWYFDGLTPRGWQQLCTQTPDKRLAEKMEHMWDTLARKERAWDLLNQVLTRPAKAAPPQLALERLYDLWVETRQDVDEIRRRLQDVDVSALVEDWHAVHASHVKLESAKHALAHVRHFFPVGVARMATAVTTDWLTATLAAYPGKRNTRRKVHSSLSIFLEYATKVKGVFRTNPMLAVDRPTEERSPIMFYELDVVERIVGWQPTPARRALMALQYGTGMEISVSLDRSRGEIDPVRREIRAPGTKAHTRDRIARIADWAWPIVWDQYAKDLLPTARLFPAEWDRWTVSDWHRATVGAGVKDTHGAIVEPGLALTEQLPLKNARHHWAVRRLRSGSSVQDVQLQLGHESPTLTLRLYGRFMPSAADRDRAEKQATTYETKRRKAGERGKK